MPDCLSLPPEPQSHILMIDSYRPCFLPCCWGLHTGACFLSESWPGGSPGTSNQGDKCDTLLACIPASLYRRMQVCAQSRQLRAYSRRGSPQAFDTAAQPHTPLLKIPLTPVQAGNARSVLLNSRKSLPKALAGRPTVRHQKCNRTGFTFVLNPLIVIHLRAEKECIETCSSAHSTKRIDICCTRDA